ncbi:MAG: nucleotidyltransferase [Epsilonproteobacteria bacterium]|nr:nucleotidyltransferase [Campylobacterota bacterium]
MNIRVLKALKEKYQEEGFLIKGVVGSFARGEKFNDIDIVYEIDEKFVERYGGFGGMIRIENIKSELEKSLGFKVDLIALSGMSKSAKKYMLRDIKYV